MLTDEQLNEYESEAHKQVVEDDWVVVEWVYDLVKDVRALQQQNKKLIDRLTELMRQVEGSTHFIVKSAPYFDAKILLQDITGGTSDERTNHTR